MQRDAVMRVLRYRFELGDLEVTDVQLELIEEGVDSILERTHADADAARKRVEYWRGKHRSVQDAEARAAQQVQRCLEELARAAELAAEHDTALLGHLRNAQALLGSAGTPIEADIQGADASPD